MDGADIGQEAVLAIIDEFAFLLLFHGLDAEANCSCDLVVGDAIEIGNPRMHFDHGIDRAQKIFARVWIVIDKGLREDSFIARRTIDGHGGGIFHAVAPVDTGLYGQPLQAMHQPSWRDG